MLHLSIAQEYCGTSLTINFLALCWYQNVSSTPITVEGYVSHDLAERLCDSPLSLFMHYLRSLRCTIANIPKGDPHSSILATLAQYATLNDILGNEAGMTGITMFCIKRKAASPIHSLIRNIRSVPWYDIKVPPRSGE